MALTAHEPITQQLIDLLDADPALHAMLEHSIALAAQINPDPITNPSQTLDDFLAFVDHAAVALPWTIAPWAELHYSTLFDQIDQSLGYFYFVLDQPLPELEGSHPYNNTLQYAEPIRSWLIDFTRSYGLFLDTPDSWCDAYLARAQADPAYHLTDGTYEDPSHWHTFNEFFARHLASPDVRPIAAPDDDRIVICPCDSTPQNFWDIDENGLVISENPVIIKSGALRNVDTLLGPSRYKGCFAGGVLTHTFLDVHDYHRYHFPVGGVVREVERIPGDVAAGGITIWDAEAGRYRLIQTDTSWQALETRALVVVETDAHGLVALLPVGMSQVSSVNLEAEVVVGARVRKGDPLGWFLFGGSDYVMVFQREAGFVLTTPERGFELFEHRLFGQEYGRLR
jgi:phosphatidylserine decarboxylase